MLKNETEVEMFWQLKMDQKFHLILILSFNPSFLADNSFLHISNQFFLKCQIN